MKRVSADVRTMDLAPDDEQVRKDERGARGVLNRLSKLFGLPQERGIFFLALDSKTAGRSSGSGDPTVRRGAHRLSALLCGLALSFTLLVGLPLAEDRAGDAAATAMRPDGRLARGVNFAHWFAQSTEGYSEKHLSSFVTDHDIELVRQAGFTHVRLPVSMEWSFTSGPVGRAYLAALTKTIAKINQAGLAVVVDVHPSQDEKRALFGPGGEAYFVEGWRALARSLAHLNPELVIFELMNEPDPIVGAQWWALQANTIKAIRTVAPNNTLIANPGGWSGIEDYAEFKPHADPNVIYTAHVYEPLLFTHQGAPWVWEIAGQIKGVDWPVDPGSAAEQAASSAANEDAAKHLQYQIAEGQFEVRWLIERFDRLVQWQQRNGNPQVYIGEFGVYRAVAPEAANLRWHEEARQAFEARGWGWAVWNYAGGFGIARAGPDNKGSWDSSLLQALGLPKAATTGEKP